MRDSSSGLWLAKLALIIAVTSVVFLMWRAESETKPLDGDAMCFVPAATSLASGHGWVNELYHPAEVADKAHPEKFTWHGVVAPKLWSVLSPAPDFNGVRQAGVAWATIGLLAFGLALARHQRLSNSMLALAILGSAWMFTHNGRPEPIAAVIVAFALLVLPCEISFPWHLIAGVGLGIVGATSPAAAALIAPWVIVAIGLSQKTLKATLLGGVTVAVISATVTLALVTASGCTPGLWIESMALHSKNVVWGRNDGGFSLYWLRSPERPLLIVGALILVCCAWRSVSKFTSAAVSVRVVMAASMVAFSLLAYRVAIRPAPCLYNLFPLFVILTVCAAGVSTRPMLPLFACAMLLPTLGLARSGAMWWTAKTTGFSRNQASTTLTDHLRMLKVADHRIGLSSGLFELADAPEVSPLHPQIVSWSSASGADFDLLVIQQANTGMLEPAAITGFHLIADHFDHQKPALAKLGLAKSSGSYAYALYGRDGAAFH